MSIEVTARHMDATQKIQDYARDKASDLLDSFPRIEHIHVILDVEKKRHNAEVVIQASNHIRIEAEDSSDKMSVSVDLAIEKAEKQLRKNSDQAQDKKPIMKHAEEEKNKGEVD